WERTGQLSVANEPHQVEWIGENPDPECVSLDAAETRARINSPTFLGGEYGPTECAMVHPIKLATEPARHAQSIGVEIFEEARVQSLTEQGGLVLHAHLGDVTADRVALCTNVFPSLLKRYRFHTVPVYDYVLMTEPLTDEQMAEIG